MTLLIDKKLLVNSLGYFNMYISAMDNMINILNNPNSTNQQKIDAENMINGEILKFNKMVNVIIQKGKFTPVMTRFSDIELGQMGII